jgi:hypothetical protein
VFDLDQARYLGDARSRGYTLDHVVQAGHARVSVLLCGSRDLRDREQASIWPSLPSHNDSARYVDIGRSVAGGSSDLLRCVKYLCRAWRHKICDSLDRSFTCGQHFFDRLN